MDDAIMSLVLAGHFAGLDVPAAHCLVRWAWNQAVSVRPYHRRDGIGLRFEAEDVGVGVLAVPHQNRLVHARWCQILGGVVVAESKHFAAVAGQLKIRHAMLSYIQYRLF